MVHTIMQHWDGGHIVLSYVIAVTGSYCTIQLMEQWRQEESRLGKLIMLALSAVTLGGSGIWCMHFTGMRALHMMLDDGTQLEVNFELGLTVLSFIFPVVGVFIGLFIASNDPFFLEIEQARRKELLGKGLHRVSMNKVVKRGSLALHIKYTALVSRLGFILGGACFAAVGVLGMHYLGMRAQRSNAMLSFNADVVAASCLIALFTATAAFWILFRALTFWPNFETLRLASALIMGVAVCGTHYTGMGAASYEFQPLAESYQQSSTANIVDGASAASVASHASLLLCFWSSTFGIMGSLRTTMRRLDKHKNKKNAIHPEGARSSITFAAHLTTRLGTLRTLAPAWASSLGPITPSEAQSDVQKFSEAVVRPAQAPHIERDRRE